MEAGLGLAADGGRKRIGNASAIGHAQPCAVVSSLAIRVRRCKIPARERIRTLRVIVHVFARVTDSTNFPRLLSATFIM